MSAQRKPMAMASILDSCDSAARQEFAPGTILISEGETSGRLYVLAEGTIEVLRGDTPVRAAGFELPGFSTTHAPGVANYLCLKEYLISTGNSWAQIAGLTHHRVARTLASGG
jgi:hypothetical protein